MIKNPAYVIPERRLPSMIPPPHWPKYALRDVQKLIEYQRDIQVTKPGS